MTRRPLSTACLLLALVTLSLAVVATISSAAPAPAPHLRSGHGLHVTAVRRVDAREVNATVDTAALGKPVNVRVLLPTGYASHVARRYPTLFLYAGTGENANSWTAYGDIEGLTRSLPLIVVMPDVGFGVGDGWFSNWLDRHTSLGPNQWETFQVRELIPWVDENFRTVADRSGRAVAGLSQGGFGSMVAATRHPDLFVSAAAFSGAVDIAYGNLKPLFQSFPISTTISDFVPPFSIFGSLPRHEVNWQGHDPTTLVTNLRGMDVHLYTGNGLPGPYDKPQFIPLGAVEVLAHAETHQMYDHAVATHVPIKLTDYGAGTHSFPYWIHDMRSYLPELMRVFARNAQPPREVSYEATAPRWSQWGWSVADRRTVAEQFTALEHAGRAGFTLAGHGTATVTTPVFYGPGEEIATTVRHGASARHLTLIADEAGRLRLRIALPAEVSFDV
ncbi:MAG TPA: alpha/beta hydrolase family protein [Mycobacteriales bacterium]|nr:alpha/beta hydrolase family protein [Mycobacteriales bacterium]